MAISLLDYTSLIKDELNLGLFKNLLRMNDQLKLWPVVDVGAFVVRGERWSVLPTGTFRKLNTDYTDSTGTTEPVEDKLAIFGGKFSEDKAYKQVKGKVFRDPVQVQFDMWTKTIERQISENIINGDEADDSNSFNGLYQRFGSGDFPASQIISYGSGDAKHVLENAASARVWFEALDETLYAADLFGSALSGVPKGALLMNKTSWLGMQKAARLVGWSVDTIDLYGYTWREYRGIPFVDVGLDRDQSTEIITNTYNPGDGGADSSRIYAVRFTQPDGDVDSPGSDGLTIVQAGGLRKLGPNDDLTSIEWGMEWILGIAHVGDDYCAALLDDFEFAT